MKTIDERLDWDNEQVKICQEYDSLENNNCMFVARANPEDGGDSFAGMGGSFETLARLLLTVAKDNKDFKNLLQFVGRELSDKDKIESAILCDEEDREQLFGLPFYVDLTPEGEIVESANVGEEGYAENIQYKLSINIDEESQALMLGYYGENDRYLTLDEVIEVFEIF